MIGLGTGTGDELDEAIGPRGKAYFQTDVFAWEVNGSAEARIA